MDFNQHTFCGRLVMDPILKSYARQDGTEGTRVFFRVAVTRLMDRGEKDRAKRRVNLIKVVAFGEAAKRHAQFLAKGTEVIVSGEHICETRQENGQWREFEYTLANDIQYGRRSTKNLSPEQIAVQTTALQQRLAEITGTGNTATVVAGVPPVAQAGVDEVNPFKNAAA